MGDALGAPYEFTYPDTGTPVAMKGGGAFGWEPGQWTDDTDMAICVAHGLVDGDGLTAASLDAIAANFRRWLASGPKDVGRQTKVVLLHGGDTAESMAAYSATKGRTGGNGSLMRTAVVGLRHLDRPDLAAEAADRISAITHPDADARLACALWSFSIAHAARHGDLDGPRRYLEEVAPEQVRGRWTDLLGQATAADPRRDFPNNGWVVHALQTAWWAITTTPGTGEGHVVGALERAVLAGGDTDTVASIAGALLGARWGLSAIPLTWRTAVHGWPGIDADGLEALAARVVDAGRSATG
ncbi:hypothetical protein MKOR_13820 [Mycolicibacillus koreensis]|nr:hypothetical protein MKOR_13820 [Mycolicibacillus koreensis]